MMLSFFSFLFHTANMKKCEAEKDKGLCLFPENTGDENYDFELRKEEWK